MKVLHDSRTSMTSARARAPPQGLGSSVTWSALRRGLSFLPLSAHPATGRDERNSRSIS